MCPDHRESDRTGRAVQSVVGRERQHAMRGEFEVAGAGCHQPQAGQGFDDAGVRIGWRRRIHRRGQRRVRESVLIAEDDHGPLVGLVRLTATGMRDAEPLEIGIGCEAVERREHEVGIDRQPCCVKRLDSQRNPRAESADIPTRIDIDRRQPLIERFDRRRRLCRRPLLRRNIEEPEVQCGVVNALNPEPARSGGVRDVPVIGRGRDLQRREQVLQTPKRLREHFEEHRALRGIVVVRGFGRELRPRQRAQRRPRRSHAFLLIGGQRREVGHVPRERVRRRGDGFPCWRREFEEIRRGTADLGSELHRPLHRVGDDLAVLRRWGAAAEPHGEDVDEVGGHGVSIIGTPMVIRPRGSSMRATYDHPTSSAGTTSSTDTW